MSKYVGTMFKYFVELCTIRGIRYMMFRTKSTNATMYIFDLTTGKYEIMNDGVSLSDIWLCTLNSNASHMVTTYKIQMSDDSQLNFLDQAIYLYDEKLHLYLFDCQYNKFCLYVLNHVNGSLVTSNHQNRQSTQQPYQRETTKNR